MARIINGQYFEDGKPGKRVINLNGGTYNTRIDGGVVNDNIQDTVININEGVYNEQDESFTDSDYNGTTINVDFWSF